MSDDRNNDIIFGAHSIIEALKLEDINNLENNNLISTNGRDKIIKFRQFY